MSDSESSHLGTRPMPAGSPMNLTCATKPAGPAGTSSGGGSKAQPVITIILNFNDIMPPAPAGSHALVPPNSNVVYEVIGHNPDGTRIPNPIHLNGANVAVYSTP